MRRGADSLALGSNLRLLNSWTWQLFDFHTSRRCRASFSCAPESQALLLPISFRVSVSCISVISVHEIDDTSQLQTVPPPLLAASLI